MATEGTPAASLSAAAGQAGPRRSRRRTTARGTATGTAAGAGSATGVATGTGTGTRTGTGTGTVAGRSKQTAADGGVTGNVTVSGDELPFTEAIVYEDPHWLAHDSPGPKYSLPSTLSPRGPLIGSSARRRMAAENVGPGPGAYLLPSPFDAPTPRSLPRALIRSDLPLVGDAVEGAENEEGGHVSPLAPPYADGPLAPGSLAQTRGHGGANAETAGSTRRGVSAVPSAVVGPSYAAPTASSKIALNETERKRVEMSQEAAPNAALHATVAGKGASAAEPGSASASGSPEASTTGSPMLAVDTPPAKTRRRMFAAHRKAKERSPTESVASLASAASSLAPFLSTKQRFQEESAIEHHSPGPKYLLPSAFGRGQAAALSPQRRRQRSLPPALRKATTPKHRPAPMVPQSEYPATPEADVDTSKPVKVFDVYACCRYPRYPAATTEPNVVTSYWERRASPIEPPARSAAEAERARLMREGVRRPRVPEPPTETTPSPRRRSPRRQSHAAKASAAPGSPRPPASKSSPRVPRVTTNTARRRRMRRQSSTALYEDDGSDGDVFITKLSISRNRERRSSAGSRV
ncbi:uncharacterized protein AMSG_11203 [Thecamonas trahens ATCC 50062]|uniref:Uncharacterized protein n=1 Tax=Thecamonas trahens ATCC 50062 TaxID=461836 RepID=A0A0L0DUA0_THETB|nr:hypothetical protein AMSG_11203 [Thecamonas trahens ATCC 50062]KNC55772.1 hypothetical protein AMSG_11203 [Thecamonas trahens ATCC 50062]|eukprot:XP_013752854.1 hypothetical protein AMSG_11203 [Thecamonas trahens ATCC 50062]